MVRPKDHINTSVGREQAEVLQQKLFAAATLALDVAMSEQKVPGNLLSACQSILQDSGLSPDLEAPETDEEALEAADNFKPNWLLKMQEEVGLPDI